MRKMLMSGHESVRSGLYQNHAPVKWRELKTYLGSVDESYEALQRPIGATILSTLAQPAGTRVGRDLPLELANLNCAKIDGIEEDRHIQDIFLNMPGVSILSQELEIQRVLYNVTTTSAVGLHMLRFMRSRVPPLDNIHGDPRTIYSMTSSPSKPLA